MFYKQTKVSLELQRDSADDGEKTGCETGGASTHDQAQQHMDDIQDFIDFQEDDSDEEYDIANAEEQMDAVSEASSISECSDSEDDNQIKED